APPTTTTPPSGPGCVPPRPPTSRSSVPRAIRTCTSTPATARWAGPWLAGRGGRLRISSRGGLPRSTSGLPTEALNPPMNADERSEALEADARDHGTVGTNDLKGVGIAAFIGVHRRIQGFTANSW